MQTLSVVVITKNEEANMPSFLANHSFADELVVVDAFSEDRTAEICRGAGAKVIENEWPGFPRQWNVGIDAATGQWILIEDADQRVTPELVAAIKDLLSQERQEHDAYYIPRRNMAFGKWIRHCGWYPDLVYPRLFKRGVARFDENKSVHEKLSFSGTAGRMHADIIHDSYHSVEQYVRKLNHYTTLEAKDRLAARKGGIGFRQVLCDKRIPRLAKAAYLKHCMPCRPLLRFLWMYVFKLGFLDGRAGLRLCLLSAFYEVVTDAKVQLLLQEEEGRAD